MTSNLNGKQSHLYGEQEEFFGGEMKPFVSFLNTEFKKAEDVLPSVPTPSLPKANWWKRFTAMFTF